MLRDKLKPLMSGSVPKWPLATHDLDWWWLFNVYLWNYSLNFALGFVWHLFRSPDSYFKGSHSLASIKSPQLCHTELFITILWKSPNHISRKAGGLPAHWFLLALTLFFPLVTSFNQKLLKCQMEPLCWDLPNKAERAYISK